MPDPKPGDHGGRRRDQPRSDQAPLGKEQRKDLLAQLERRSSRTEPPERILQRGEQALKDEHLGQARRVLQQLESSVPELPGLDSFRQNLAAAESEERRRSNLQATEEMLIRYIQQRMKPLAEMALETLVELSPNHPRRGDYEHWVADLDEEVAHQRRIEEQFDAGRAAVQKGDLRAAEKHLEALHKDDPDSSLSQRLASKIVEATQGQALSAGIQRAKQELEELLAANRLDEAEQQMVRLSRMDIPKVTIDVLRQRLEEGRQKLRDQAEAAKLLKLFEQFVGNGDWPSAREVAQRYGGRFPASERTGELFGRINEMEAAQRRRQSLDEGLAAVELFIDEGKRHEADLALKLLESLALDPAKLERLRERVGEI
ncbi:MAG: hypothetical protein GY719_19225 [bacterium]|nr:hypothetical protein [bacterium]